MKVTYDGDKLSVLLTPTEAQIYIDEIPHWLRKKGPNEPMPLLVLIADALDETLYNVLEDL